MLMVIFGAGASHDSAQAYRLPPPRASQQNFGAQPRVELAEIWRPPLANDLFLDRHQAFGKFAVNYPKIRPILPLLRERSQKSVEEVLEELQSETEEYSERRRQLASVRYYLRDLLYECTSEWIKKTNGVTNYGSVIDQILRWHTRGELVLVTFNYDLLLETHWRTSDSTE